MCLFRSSFLSAFSSRACYNVACSGRCAVAVHFIETFSAEQESCGTEERNSAFEGWKQAPPLADCYLFLSFSRRGLFCVVFSCSA